jgi:hypothetical protein
MGYGVRGGSGGGDRSGEETSGDRSCPQTHLLPSVMGLLQRLRAFIGFWQRRHMHRQKSGASPHCPPPGLMCGHIFTLVVCLPQYTDVGARPSKLRPGGGAAPLVLFGGIDEDQMTKLLSVVISKSTRLQRTACTPDCCCAALIGCAVTALSQRGSTAHTRHKT